MTGRPVRVGVVGYGYWGPNLVRNLDRLPDAHLVVVCDVSADRLAELSTLYPGVATTTDLDTLLTAHDLDAVVVVTSAPTHYDIASRVIEAGLHCFVEKPLTMTSIEAAALVKAADEADVVLMVGHLMVYHSAIDWMKSYIESGEIGDVHYVYAQRLNLGKVRAEENAFWSLAPHDVSVILHLLGESPDEVSASGAHYLRDGIHDVVFANLRFPGGQTANIHVSWLDPHKVRKLTVVGSKKMLVFDDMQGTEKVWVYDKGVEPKQALAYGEDLSLRFGDVVAPFIKMSEPLATEMQHFLDCCVTGAVPRSDGRAGLGVVRVLEAVDESMAAGGSPVSLDLEV